METRAKPASPGRVLSTRLRNRQVDGSILKAYDASQTRSGTVLSALR